MYGQVDKIKIKKDEPNPYLFKNDTCDYNVIISKNILDKKLALLSIDMDDSYEKEIALTNSFLSIVSFIGTTIDINPKSIQMMCLNVCKINGFKLMSVEVKRHETTNASIQNSVDIYLKYKK